MNNAPRHPRPEFFRGLLVQAQTDLQAACDARNRALTMLACEPENVAHGRALGVAVRSVTHLRNHVEGLQFCVARHEAASGVSNE